MTKDQIREKCLSALITLALVLSTTYDEFTFLFTLFGQGHFLAAYYFQYRAGKITRSYLAAYATAFAVVFGGYALLQPNVQVVYGTATVWFGVHAISDELFLLRSAPSLSRTLLALAVIVEYVWLSAASAYPGAHGLWVVIFSTTLLGLSWFLKTRAGEGVNGVDIYFAIGTAILSTLILCHVDASIHPILGALIIYHYSNWYLNNFFRFRHEPLRLKHYLRVVLTINLSLLALALGVVACPQMWTVLYYFFSALYFNLWTIMHMFSTLRPADRAHVSPQLLASAMHRPRVVSPLS